MTRRKKNASLEEIHQESERRATFALSLRKGMKVRYVGRTDQSLLVKHNDVVHITSLLNVGTDWEQVRVSNGKFTWRVSSYDLEAIQADKRGMS